jgi:hypothetical protein
MSIACWKDKIRGICSNETKRFEGVGLTRLKLRWRVSFIDSNWELQGLMPYKWEWIRDLYNIGGREREQVVS